MREKLLQIQTEAIEGAVREVEAEEKKRVQKKERADAKLKIARLEAAALQSSKDLQIVQNVLLGLVNKVVTYSERAKAEADAAAADPVVSPLLSVPAFVSEKVSVATAIMPHVGPEADGSRQMEGADER